jgi:2-amino-4-hydroxy-6-hydroxymethyldihydropteridine diphosphokinase
MAVVYIAAGSSLGDREQYIITALNLINKNARVSIEKISPVYETAPLGEASHNTYLNFVFTCSTSLTPEELFAELKSVEAATGRQKRSKWSEREIDLDILLYDRQILSNDILTIPHKEIKNRDFVLIPMLEIDKTLTDPVTGKPYLFFAERLEKRFVLHKLPKKLIEKEKTYYFEHE